MRRVLVVLLGLIVALGANLVAQPLPARAVTGGTAVYGQESLIGPGFGEKVLSPEMAIGPDGKGGHLAYYVTSGNTALTAYFQAIDVKTGARVFGARVPAGVDSWGIAVEGTTVTFAANDGSTAYLYSWAPGRTALTNHGTPFGAGQSVWSLTGDGRGTIFVGTYPGGQLWQWSGGAATLLGVPNPGEKYVRALAANATTVYAGSLGTGKLAAYDRASKLLKPIAIPAPTSGDNTMVADLELRGKWLTVYTKSSSDLRFYDTTTGTFSATVITGVSGGELSPVYPVTNNHIFFQRSNFGIAKLDLTTLAIERTGYSAQTSPGAWEWVDLGDPTNFPGKALVAAGALGTLWAYDVSVVNLSTRPGHQKDLNPDVVGAAGEVRSLGAGPDGKVYLGGYLNPTGLRSYAPSTGAFDEIKGIPQIEGFGTQGSRLLGGAYPRAGLMAYDTTKPVTYSAGNTSAGDLTANPSIYEIPAVQEQERPFDFQDLGNGNVAVATVANKNTAGGSITIWAPGTSQTRTYRNPIADQSVVSLAKAGNVLVAGSSINGGTGYTSSQALAYLFTFDPATGAVIDKVVPSSEGRVAWVNALTVDPRDGTVWGIAGTNLFHASISSAGTITLLRSERLWDNNSGFYGNDFGLEFHNQILYAAAGGELRAINPLTFASQTLATGGVTDLVRQGDSLYYVKNSMDLYRWRLASSTSFAPQLGSHRETAAYAPGSQVFSGLGQPGSTVSVVVGGVQVATAVVAANGEWRTAAVNVPFGQQTVTLKSTINGVSSPAVTYSIAFLTVASSDLGLFRPIDPVRVMDTRSSFGAKGPVLNGSEASLVVAGRNGIPANATAVVMNVTVTNTMGEGYLTVYPQGANRPKASNLNFVRGQDVPNLVQTKIGDGGRVQFFNGSSGSLNVIADISGYFVPAGETPGAFKAVTPARVLDTRDGTGAPAGVVGAGSTVALKVAGAGGVPATGVGAVVLNVTVVDPTMAGYVTAYPAGRQRPTASNVNFVPGVTVPNLVTVRVGDGGVVNIVNGADSGSVHLIADVAGWYTAGDGVLPGSFVPLDPYRLLDSRSGLGFQGPLNGGTEKTLAVARRGGVPATGAGAAVMNLTVTAPTAAGYLTAYPTGGAKPTTSNVNFVAGQTIANLSVVKLGGGRTQFLHGTYGTLHAIADVAGYFKE